MIRLFSRSFVLGLLIASFLALNGCGASFFACTTKLSFNPETGAYFYESCKDQQGLKARVGNAEIETTASTPEAAIAAALQANLVTQQNIAKMMAVLETLTKTAATKGAVP